MAGEDEQRYRRLTNQALDLAQDGQRAYMIEATVQLFWSMPESGPAPDPIAVIAALVERGLLSPTVIRIDVIPCHDN